MDGHLLSLLNLSLQMIRNLKMYFKKLPLREYKRSNEKLKYTTDILPYFTLPVVYSSVDQSVIFHLAVPITLTYLAPATLETEGRVELQRPKKETERLRNSLSSQVSRILKYYCVLLRTHNLRD